MRLLRASAVTLVVLAALAGCHSKARGSTAAPPFELKDLSGHKISLDAYKGHPVLLDFWATWCGPCQISIPLVQRFFKEHEDKGLIVLGMNVDDDPSGVYPFVKHFQMTYPVLYAGGTPVPEAYQVEGIPTFVFIDAQGRIAKRYEGFRPDMAEEWEYEFQQLTATK